MLMGECVSVKKVLKIIGKVIGGILGAILGFVALCCIVTLCWGGVQRSRGDVFNTLPEVPDDFVPTVRLMVFTDSHNNNERVADGIDTAYELFDNDPVYAGIDGIFGLGDFSSIGCEDNYVSFIETLNEHVRKETPVYSVLGNHEMKQKNAHDIFVSQFGYEPNLTVEINGFTCILFSGERSLTEWTFTPKSLKWAADQLKIAEEKNDGKAIFSFQHPHNFGTVYGSSVWGDFQTNPIWAGHSNVVNFSGHSHFPMNDPRSINQSTYTSVGCGGMDRFELDNMYIVGQHPDGYDTAAQICIVEADDDGSVRIREYDLNSDTFFNDYYIENVNDKDTFAYTYKNLKAHDSAPRFKENTKAEAFKNENGEWVISFDEAESAYIVHDYRVKIKDSSGKKIFSKNFVDDYYVIDDDSTADFRIGKDTLVSGQKYTLVVTAKSAYHLKSDTLELEFTAK